MGRRGRRRARGGYWTNARKAFEFAAIGRFKPGNHTLEAFYLDRDELPESDSDSKLWGVNYEYAFGEDTTLGATYMKWSADPNVAPQRDGLNVFNLRAYTAPFPNLKALSFEAEYAKEDNGDALDSTAWNVLAAYQLELAWQPKLSYRYAFFEGDDPATPTNEASTGCPPAFTTGAPGGRARSAASTSSRTRTSSRTSCACTRRRAMPSRPD